MFQCKKMENSFIENLMEITTSPQKINDFVYFCYVLQERTGCKGRRCNLEEMVKKMVEASRKDGSVKVNDFVEACEQNTELIQALFLLSKNRLCF